MWHRFTLLPLHDNNGCGYMQVTKCFDCAFTPTLQASWTLVEALKKRLWRDWRVSKQWERGGIYCGQLSSPLTQGDRQLFMLTFTQFWNHQLTCMSLECGRNHDASGKNMHQPAIHLHHDSHHFHSYQSIERASFDFQRVPASVGLQS